MFNLKQGGGSFKGIIGECMFKLTNDKVVVTKFFNKNKYMHIFEKYFTEEQRGFLYNHWHSIDAIDLLFVNGKKETILYEIKTRNSYQKELYFKPKMTRETHELYNKAKLLGFTVKIATVWLGDNWNYDVEINGFDEKDYYIDSPKQYDKKSEG